VRGRVESFKETTYMNEHEFDPKRPALIPKGIRRRAHAVLRRDDFRRLRDELQGGATWDPRLVANALNVEVETLLAGLPIATR
jgi:hypothetical protein